MNVDYFSQTISDYLMNSISKPILHEAYLKGKQPFSCLNTYIEFSKKYFDTLQ
jgi:hypothetical protein